MPLAAGLSGGTQQKLVLAKWLAAKCRILILDEPTRGVDVGAKAEIHALIDELAAAGSAVLLISSELPEVLHLSTRIIVAPQRPDRRRAAAGRGDAGGADAPDGRDAGPRLTPGAGAQGLKRFQSIPSLRTL